jgi:hypothetical protein
MWNVLTLSSLQQRMQTLVASSAKEGRGQPSCEVKKEQGGHEDTQQESETTANVT